MGGRRGVWHRAGIDGAREGGDDADIHPRLESPGNGSEESAGSVSMKDGIKRMVNGLDDERLGVFGASRGR